MYGGYRCENHVQEFAESVGFVNMLKIAHKHPQVNVRPQDLSTAALVR